MFANVLYYILWISEKNEAVMAKWSSLCRTIACLAGWMQEIDDVLLLLYPFSFYSLSFGQKHLSELQA